VAMLIPGTQGMEGAGAGRVNLVFKYHRIISFLHSFNPPRATILREASTRATTLGPSCVARIQ
jgi:hypothetical protein